MKRPASMNARPAFSHVLFFLLAVIMFSISLMPFRRWLRLCRPQRTRRASHEIQRTFLLPLENGRRPSSGSHSPHENWTALSIPKVERHITTGPLMGRSRAR